MQNLELVKFIKEELQDRWPEWTPTDAQFRDINEWLSKYPYSVAAKAAQEHRKQNDYRTPNIGKIYSACKAAPETEQKKYTHCYAVFDDGWLREVIVPTLPDDSEDHIRAVAQNHFARDYYKNFGDNYTLFIGRENHSKAFELYLEIKKQKALQVTGAQNAH